MARIAKAAVLLLASTSVASAGGLERDAWTTGILFEEGTYLSFGLTYAAPDISGEHTIDPTVFSPIGTGSGDMAPAYHFSRFAYRQDLNDGLSFALSYDQPIGADVDYRGVAVPPPPGTSVYQYSFGSGSQAQIDSAQYTAALRYEMPTGVSVYGGLRAVSVDVDVSLFDGSGFSPAPAVGTADANYTFAGSSAHDIGFLIGAAFERPETGLRFAVTYISATTHDLDAQETVDVATSDDPVELVIPQQLLLEAQTDLAEGTQAFGSIRWVDWSAFALAPQLFSANYPDQTLWISDYDTITYTLGGAQRLSDALSILGSIAYEPAEDALNSNLSPTNGRTTLGLGARYDINNLRITAGASYTWYATSETERPLIGAVPANNQLSVFEDNSSLGLDLDIGIAF